MSTEGLFRPVSASRTFEAIIAQVQEAILSGKLRYGDRLASERELVQQFGVSRATLREALRSLEALGWIEIRPGAQGGIFVVRPSTDRAGSALEAL
ncbi:MAG TPA: GntR family transcriptional regulator, partial [Chloroflexota bacterium]